jgi:hypothetical protein
MVDPRIAHDRSLPGGTTRHATMQGWVEGYDDSHHVRQPVIWWRRRAGGGDEVVVVNPSEDSSLGARRGEVEWYKAMQCRIARWRCLL